jgi:hypothetical protein
LVLSGANVAQDGLKIRFPIGSVGSIPALGTNGDVRFWSHWHQPLEEGGFVALKASPGDKAAPPGLIDH